MFENASALYLLLILLPVIILYFLRPKPKPIKIPSLMLLLSSGRKRKLNSLFDKLIKDPLLLIQLLAMTIIVLGIADPYFIGTAQYDRTIIVLDASASMSASDVKPSRFSQAMEIARNYLDNSGKNSLILARDVPLLLFNNEESRHAIDKLNGIRPEATGTDLNEAIMSALMLMGNGTAKLVVISDFSGQDITEVQKTVESKNIPVKYLQVGIGGSNTGIVDAAIKDSSLEIVIRSYENVTKDINIRIKTRDSTKLNKRTIKPESREFISIVDPDGITEIKLEEQDDLLLDNALNINMPNPGNNRILLLGDSKNKAVSTAFKSIPDLEVDELSFERAPRKMDYAMVVLYDYSKSSFLPGTMEDIKKYVLDGGTVVFEAVDDLPFIDTKDLLPVHVSGLSKPSRIDAKSSELTNGIDFGTSKYLKGTTKEGAVELASGEEGPVLAYHSVEKGKVVYVGINEKWSDFHLQESYPIFWYRLLEFSNPASFELNLESGNLLNEKESDISIPQINFTGIEKNSGTGSFEKIRIYTILAFLAMLLVALELYYLKYRGEI